MFVPCSTCVGCHLAKARAWAIRCRLELQDHPAACWVTLTYDEAHVPPTLHKRHLQGWFKRVRHHVRQQDNVKRRALRIKVKDYKHYRRVRFFACGEYGELNGRPHYHAIIFGLDRHSSGFLSDKWGMGNVQIDELSPAAMAYVCGYALKKAGKRDKLVLGGRVSFFDKGPATANTFVDKTTGELYRLRIKHEPEFLLMSRRPGIGGNARRFATSWRSSAIWGGKEVPVPRYLHQSWKSQATPEQLLALATEQFERQPFTLDALQERARHLAASAIINRATRAQKLSRRKL